MEAIRRRSPSVYGLQTLLQSLHEKVRNYGHGGQVLESGPARRFRILTSLILFVESRPQVQDEISQDESAGVICRAYARRNTPRARWRALVASASESKTPWKTT